MAWKFLNIGKANAEIDRLNGEVENLTKERDEARTALESNNSEALTQAEGLQVQVTAQAESIKAKDAEISTLTAAVAAKDAELATVKAELSKAQEQLANPSAQVQKAAAIKAAEITGAQGQPPIVTAPPVNPAQPDTMPALKGLAKAQAAIKAQISK